MDFGKLLERLPYNEEGKRVLNDDFVEQTIKNFFSSKDGTKYAQYFMLEGFCGKDISEIDMSGLSPQYFKMITFDKETKFSQEQIEKFNPSELIEQGKKFSDVKDEGSLHDKGIKGKGTTIALLDSSFNSAIEEFGDRVKQHLIFQKVNGEVIVRPYNEKDGNGFHGETTSSLAAGKECGVAPEADLILFGIDMDSWPQKGPNGENQADLAWTEARAALFNYIKNEVEKGAMKLPDIISISADYKTLPEAQKAEDWLNINNCAIIDSEKFWDYFSLGRKNDEDKIVLEEFVKTIYSDDFQYDKNSSLGKKIDETKEKSKNSTIMPFAGRTSVHTGKNGQPVEKYNGSLCGASFAIAQVSGLFLLARQEDKDLSFDNFVKIIKDTRMKNKKEGIMYASATEIINEVKERSKTKGEPLGKIEDGKELDVLGKNKNTSKNENSNSFNIKESAIEATRGIRTGKMNEEAQKMKSKQKEKMRNQDIVKYGIDK